MGGTTLSSNRKRTLDGFSAMTSREKQKITNENGKDVSTPLSSMNNSFNLSIRDRVLSQGSSYTQHQQMTPKPHTGPFNVKCLFMENAESLIRKIKDFLRQQNVRFVEQ
jgi:hypothetical protein